MDYYKHIRKRLRNIGVSPEDSATVASWYIQQIRHRGKDGAIDYLKRVGDTILWYLYGSPAKPPWVATKHRFPKAVYCLRKYSTAVLLRVAKVARAITLDKVTPKQVAKVAQAALAPYNGEPGALEEMSQVISLGLSLSGICRPACQPSNPPLVGREWARFKSVSGKTEVGFAPPIQESLDIVFRVPALWQLPYWTEVFHPISPLWLEDKFERFTGTEYHPVGQIHAAQEGGGKLRMYAAPHTVVQCLLSPIHDWVDSMERTLPTSCRYHQEAGANWAASQLSEGRTVYSVDLSTATCRFPLKVQLDLLRSLGLEEKYLEALEWACTGDWVVGDELRPEFPDKLTWLTGQPLGIRPSMSMFSLAHNLLLRGLCHLTNTDPDSFRVLGDDVVMVGEQLHAAYRSMMTRAGVPISEHKCHMSGSVAEFAGYTISREIMVRPGQWRQPGVNNHLGLARDLRTPLTGEVSQKWVEVEKLQLFIDGIYNPPVESYSRYVKAATAARTDLTMDPPDPIQEVTLWETGIRRHIRNQLGHEVPLLAVRRDWVSSIYRGLPPVESIQAAKHMSAWWTHTTPDQVMIEAHTALCNALVVSEVTLEQFRELVARVSSNVRSLYWIPPASGKRLGGSQHRRLEKILASV